MSVASLAASLARIGQVQPRLSAPDAMLMAIVGILVAVVPGLWQVARPFTAMAHEGAHATVGSALGHSIVRMHFKFNGDGATETRGDGSSLIAFSIAFIGYLGPSAFGIGAAELIRSGHVVAVPWIAVGGLIVIVFLARRSIGVIAVIAAFLVLLGIVGGTTVSTQELAAYAITWFLLSSGIRIILIHGKNAVDAQRLRDLTGLPRGFWPILWLAGSAAALLFGATLLL